MKILISTDTYYPHVNGASYFTQRLAYHLKKRGHDILVIAPSTNFSFGYTEANGISIFGVRSVGNPFLKIHNFRFVLPFAINKKIEKAVLDFNPDVVHVQGHFVVSKSVIRAAQKANIPLKGTNHFMPENLTHYLHLPHFLEDKINNWAWNDFRKVYENLNVVTTPTQTAANLIKKTGFSGEVYPVSCGINLERFSPSKKDKTIKKRYNLPEIPLILFLGRIDKEKNVDFVLRAISKLPESFQLHFAIAGSGAEKKKLEEMVKEMQLQNRVSFLGFVPDEDVPVLFASSDCFINAGVAELQCIAMMEAMASGLPVLGVDAVALPELVHHEENGYLFSMEDSGKLTEKIIKMLSDKNMMQKMGKKSLEIIQQHDINKVMERYEFLYEKIINENKNGKRFRK